jgi:hypothetical protein
MSLSGVFTLWQNYSKLRFILNIEIFFLSFLEQYRHGVYEPLCGAYTLAKKLL